MNCLEILSSFLKKTDISRESYCKLLDKLVCSHPEDLADVSFEEGQNVVHQILVDTYALNAPKVKFIADTITKRYQPIGRREKDLIKHYLDYQDNNSLEALCIELEKCGADHNSILTILNNEYEDLSFNAINLFINNWGAACKADDASKKFDYLQGIYSRLTSLLNESTLSLLDIYRYNEKFIAEELTPVYQTEILDFCTNDRKISAKQARAIFCKRYEYILSCSLKEESRTNRLEPVMNLSSCAGTPFEKFDAEEFNLVFININQELYDISKNDEDFLNKVLSLLYYSYRVLDNHRTLSVNLDNVFTKEGKNLKWMLYSYIGIYAEHFIPTVEHRMFYKPEELCYDKCEYLGIELSDAQKNAFKQYFRGKIDVQELQSSINLNTEELQNILLDFENIWYGYTFSDCIAIESGEYRQNDEISFIKNKTQVLLVFNKYRHDDRKIPCPECAGLDISGNSFPEVGLRSWECKNAICPSRSKSNRGKRYSKKTNFMQLGFDNSHENDIISRDMIKQWRRDITKVKSQSEIYEMLVKYFSFDEERVLFVNTLDASSKIISKCGRVPTLIDLEEINSMRVLNNVFNNYFNDGGYINRYLNQIVHPDAEIDDALNERIDTNSGALLIHGNSRNVLATINDNTFTAAVTSPPYYNARLYSQWPNLYLYLSDMYEIIKETYRTMKPGGIYLYNIGDICGNENTVVGSTMGNKRILLGAYTIHLFAAAGFELLDNILWDKGNPQSNRQKNDGKFTPFYQKPMNVYEHMFVFKKPGAPAIVANDVSKKLPKEWKTNIAPFSPVIKINSKGENTLGHTAPFPEDIPRFVAKVFTQTPDDIVLEPFAGSGTTLIACSKCNVKSLGIELCDEYANLILEQGQRNNISIKKI